MLLNLKDCKYIGFPSPFFRRELLIQIDYNCRPTKKFIPERIRHYYESSLSSNDFSDSWLEEEVAPPYAHEYDNVDDGEIVIDTDGLLLWLENQTPQIDVLSSFSMRTESEGRGRGMRRGHGRDRVDMTESVPKERVYGDK